MTGADDGVDESATRAFVENRRRILAIAYGILGTLTDAEEVAQDAWIRWSNAPVDDVRDPRAYLTRMASRLALNRLRDSLARRETYVGPWLPEPVATGPDAAQYVERADEVSMALLVVLETLTPTQRAVFVLREVFGYSYREIAEYLGGSEPSVRQMANRARADVRARRSRFETDRRRHAEVTRRFLRACSSGNVNELIEAMSAGATLLADGGGRVGAARQPVVGPEKVAHLLVALATGRGLGIRMRMVEANGQPALVGWADSGVAVSVHLVLAGDRVDQILMVRNPDKLSGLGSTKPDGTAA
ncbi:RNA polymerase sigma factor SigJ [Plantactinospora sp. WMMB782]|uniref:RNA polymerase sigma factor SigJ n=1 Tax=Plantactinospora sp. WMMB782 TaxID=3404121 RepID=UPI003B925326